MRPRLVAGLAWGVVVLGALLLLAGASTLLDPPFIVVPVSDPGSPGYAGQVHAAAFVALLGIVYGWVLTLAGVLAAALGGGILFATRGGPPPAEPAAPQDAAAERPD